MLILFGPLVLTVLTQSLPGCCPPGVSRARSHESSGGEDVGDLLRGEVSYYASSLSGRRTASGERYDPRKLTAASRDLPLGTRVRVTRLDTGKSVEVRINDRGPFGHRSRILDLSRAAARELGMIGRGTVEVRAEILSVP